MGPAIPIYGAIIGSERIVLEGTADSLTGVGRIANCSFNAGSAVPKTDLGSEQNPDGFFLRLSFRPHGAKVPVAV